jgi:nitrate reductase delta subunit
MIMDAIGNQTVTLHPPLSWFAEFLEYPKDASLARWEMARQRIGEFYPGAGDALGRFLEIASKMELGELESLYLRTFEIAAPCIPYISIHLFGEESFERGAFMAKLLDRYGQLEFQAGEELPDHLSVMLRFADRVEGEELRELLQYCLLRPVQIMMERLEASNPYVQVLASLLEVLSGKAWTLWDIDMHSAFRKGNRRLSLIDVLPLIGRGDYQLEPLALSIPLAVGWFERGGYAYDLWMETLFCSEKAQRGFYQRVMMAAGIEGHWLSASESSRRSLVLRKPGVLGRQEFRTKLYKTYETNC